MSYQTQNNTSATQNPTQNSNSVNLEEQIFNSYPKLANNPDIKIFECPLSQSINKTDDNSGWINEFKEPIFIAAGSEVKVQSVFVESRGISGDILVFDSVNDLTSRNDNVEHLYSYYVNNTGFNDMVLGYDIKARNFTAPNQKADSGHNYKKYKLQKYTNNIGRKPFFVGGNCIHKRIIRTSVDTYFQIPPNLDNVLGIESLFTIGVREDPFCSGRFFTSTTNSDNRIKLNLGLNKCFQYGEANDAEILFYKFPKTTGISAIHRGFLLIDFGCTQNTYQTYISSQEKGVEETFIDNTERFYAFNNFQKGDIIKFNVADIKEVSTTDTPLYQNKGRIATSKLGGFFQMQGKINLKNSLDPEVKTAYTSIITQLKTRAEETPISAQNVAQYQHFLKFPYGVYSRNFDSSHPQEPFFMRQYYITDSATAKIFFLTESISTFKSTLSMVTPIYEISKTQLSNVIPKIVADSWLLKKDVNNTKNTFGFDYPTLPITTNVLLPNDMFKLLPTTTFFPYQYQPNRKLVFASLASNLNLKYLTGGNNTTLTSLTISSCINDFSTQPPSSLITITGLANELKLNILNMITNCEIALLEDSSSASPQKLYEQVIVLPDMHSSTNQPTISADTTQITFRAFRAIGGGGQTNTPTKILFYLNNFFSSAITNNDAIVDGIGSLQTSKFMAIIDGDRRTYNPPQFQLFNVGEGSQSELYFDSPKGYWGEFDVNSDYYDTNFNGLLHYLTNNQIDEYNEGCGNIISSATSLSNFNNSKMSDINNAQSFDLTGLTRDNLCGTFHNTARQTIDNEMKFNDFIDDSQQNFMFVDFYNKNAYKVPKPYMSPSDLSSDYTDKTHASLGIIDYDNANRYTDTNRLGIFQNNFIIPIAGSDLPLNDYDTATGLQIADLTNGLNFGGFEPNSFRAVGTMHPSLLTHTAVSTDNNYYMYFRNRHSYIRNYDPYDPTRTKLSVVSHSSINNTDPAASTHALLWDLTSQPEVAGTFAEEPFQTTTSFYPISYCTTIEDTKGNTTTESHRISQFCGAQNGITLDFNNSLSLFEFSFLHTPYNTNFDTDSNSGGNSGVVVNYPTQQFVENIEQTSGVKILNWTKPNYRKNMFKHHEISTLVPKMYPNGLNPFIHRDPIGLRFMNKLGFTEETLSNNEASTFFSNTDIGTTGSDVDAASAIIFEKGSTEDEPNSQSNIKTTTTHKAEYVNKPLGDRIFYPYGISDTGGMKDNSAIRYDFALPRFSSIGGLRTTNHNTGLGLPNTINSSVYTDDTTIPRTMNPDFKKYSSYIIAANSNSIRADNLPIKFENGYFLLQSNLCDNNPNFYLGKEGQGLNILSTILKTYISGDFIISSQSPFAFYTKSDQYVSRIESRIINSNGDSPANLGPNSAVIYQVTNYTPRDATAQPTIEDTQDREYALLNMIDKFDKSKSKSNPIQVAVQDIGSLADVIIHPNNQTDSADIMGELRQKIIDYDVPNMTKNEREIFFTQDPVGQRIYGDIQAGNSISEYLQQRELLQEQEQDSTQDPQLSRRIVSRMSQKLNQARMRIKERQQYERGALLSATAGSTLPKPEKNRKNLYVGEERIDYFERALQNDRRVYDNHTLSGEGRTGLNPAQIDRLGRFRETLDTDANPNRSQGVIQLRERYSQLTNPKIGDSGVGSTEVSSSASAASSSVTTEEVKD